MNSSRQARPISSNLSSAVGPCYLKLLVSNIVAGSIIGQKGATILSITSKTGCTVRLSHASCYFPGTNERVVAMWGTLEQMKEAFLIILEKIRDAPSSVDGMTLSPPTRELPSGKMVSKIVVPNSAVSQLIGKQGSTIKELQEATGSKIQISNRDEHHFKERVVIISGTFDSVCKASFEVMEAVQSDPHIKDHTEINYVVSLPLVVPPNNGINGMFHSSGAMMGGGGGGGPGTHGMVSMASPHDLMHSVLQMNPNGTQGYFPFFQQQGFNPNVAGGAVATTTTTHLDVPDNFVGLMIGKQGSTLQAIQQQSGAKLHVSGKGEFVPGTELRRVSITGPPASIGMAHMLLQKKIREIEEVTRGRLLTGSSGSVGLSSNQPSSASSAVVDHPMSNRLPMGLGITMNGGTGFGNLGIPSSTHSGVQQSTFGSPNHPGGVFSQFSSSH